MSRIPVGNLHIGLFYINITTQSAPKKLHKYSISAYNTEDGTD